MKEVFIKFIMITVYFKNGEVFKTDSNVFWRPSKYYYDVIPENKKQIITDPNDMFDTLLLDYKDFVYGSGKTLFGKKRYVELRTRSLDYYCYKFFLDDIERIEIDNRFLQVHNPIIEDLKKDLGFNGFTELLFNRKKELESMLLDND